MRDEAVLFWVEVQEPEAVDYEILREEFHFHPLAIEDVQHGHNRPKIDIYERYYFLVLYSVSYDAESGHLETRELEMFIGPNYVVTIHEGSIQEVEEVLERWQRNVDTLGVDVGALVYTLVDRVVDDYFPVIDEVAERIEILEEAIFEEFDKNALEAIFTLKKDLLAMRRVVTPERDVFNVLLRRDPQILPAEAMPYFQDIYDHTIRVTDSLDTYRDLLSSALDAYLSVQGNRLNEIMHRLTLISLIFLPLTVLTGFFGMNFEGLPFGSNSVMWLAFLSMILTPGALMWFVWRQGWHDYGDNSHRGRTVPDYADETALVGAREVLYAAGYVPPACARSDPWHGLVNWPLPC